MIEENENNIRKEMNNIYIGKTKDIIFNCRYLETKQEEDNKKKLAGQMMKKKLPGF